MYFRLVMKSRRWIKVHSYLVAMFGSLHPTFNASLFRRTIRFAEKTGIKTMKSLWYEKDLRIRDFKEKLPPFLPSYKPCWRHRNDSVQKTATSPLLLGNPNCHMNLKATTANTTRMPIRLLDWQSRRWSRALNSEIREDPLPPRTNFPFFVV